MRTLFLYRYSRHFITVRCNQDALVTMVVGAFRYRYELRFFTPQKEREHQSVLSQNSSYKSSSLVLQERQCREVEGDDR